MPFWASAAASTTPAEHSALTNAPFLGHIATKNAALPTLPFYRKSAIDGEPPLVCAAYQATCVGRSSPPRATLSLATGPGGLGLGEPVEGNRWKLRPKDFCKGPPHELAEQSVPFEDLPADTPKPPDCFCPTNSLDARFANDPRGFGRQVPSGALPKVGRFDRSMRCAPGRSFIAYQCSRALLLPPPSSAGKAGQSSRHRRGDVAVDVLLATSDHFGHGVFALVQRVLNQIAFAKTAGLEPHVFLGEYTFMEPQACEYGRNPYFSHAVGSNVWEYWFEQPGRYVLGAAAVEGVPVASVQITTVESSAETPIRTYGPPEARVRGRKAAHAMLGTNGTRLVRREVREAAAACFRPWRQRSQHIIGMHMRGTDKVVMPKVPPEAYFPLLDAYLAAHDDALIFLATDDRKYARRLGARYPFGARVVSRGQGYEDASWGGRADSTEMGKTGPRRSPLHGAKAGRAKAETARATRVKAASGYQKGTEVLFDALLLSMCDFVLITVSAVSEFAMWVAPHLWTRHLNLQAQDRFKGQTMPSWTTHVPGATPTRRRPAVAAAFCEALATACAAEGQKRLYGGRWCSKCEPAAKEAADAQLAGLPPSNASARAPRRSLKGAIRRSTDPHKPRWPRFFV